MEGGREGSGGREGGEWREGGKGGRNGSGERGGEWRKGSRGWREEGEKSITACSHTVTAIVIYMHIHGIIDKGRHLGVPGVSMVADSPHA